MLLYPAAKTAVHCNKNHRKHLALLLILGLFPPITYASEFAAIVKNVDTDVENAWYELNADIEYKLSPTAKKALQKGIPLTWIVLINLEQKGILWNTTLKRIKINFQIQNHALLNLYSVKTNNQEPNNLFSTLTAAMNSISIIRKLPLIESNAIQPDENYFLSIKIFFNREALPIPLRPMSYFNPQWALSSQWSQWQLQN